MTADAPSPDRADVDDRTTRRQVLAGLAAATTLPALAGCITISQDTKQATDSRSIAAGPLSTLDVVSRNGDVTIQTREGERVTIRATKRARGDTSLADLSVDATVSGDRLEVETTIQETPGFGSGWIDLELDVPPHIDLEAVEAVDGDVRLSDTTGDAAVEATDGDLYARRVAGAFDVSVQDGDIDVRDGDGPVAAHVGDGDIRIQDPGSIDSLVVTDGDVRADVPAVARDATVETTDGSIVLRLGPDLDAHIEASTIDGEVVGVDAVDAVDIATETAIHGTTGSGSNTLTVHATDGDVTLVRTG